MRWSEQHQIAARTENGFGVYLENWKKNDRNSFIDTFLGKSNVKLLKTELSKFSLTRNFNYIDCVSCEMSIDYLGQSIGS